MQNVPSGGVDAVQRRLQKIIARRDRQPTTRAFRTVCDMTPKKLNAVAKQSLHGLGVGSDPDEK